MSLWKAYISNLLSFYKVKERTAFIDSLSFALKSLYSTPVQLSLRWSFIGHNQSVYDDKDKCIYHRVQYLQTDFVRSNKFTFCDQSHVRSSTYATKGIIQTPSRCENRSAQVSFCSVCDPLAFPHFFA